MIDNLIEYQEQQQRKAREFQHSRAFRSPLRNFPLPLFRIAIPPVLLVEFFRCRLNPVKSLAIVKFAILHD